APRRPLTVTTGRGRRSSGDEKSALLEALEQCDGNKAEAARLLGIPRSTFFSKLKKHGLG
ncbi:MAG TPA: helix-turn-helix domain-containing protein, partial [Planctomicrobium sp.]|nr:helix-turn-helix domain-containing protein [Planctomicrobium sp.]